MRVSDTAIDSFGLSDIRYERHPAFSGVAFDDDAQIESLAAALSAVVEDVRNRAMLPSTDVAYQLRTRVEPAADRLFAALKDKHGEIEIFGAFVERLKQQVMTLLAEDLGVLADRGVHVYVDTSPRADAIADSLCERGFWPGCLDAAAVSVLNTAMAGAKKLLWTRHEAERRIDRESLSINEWDGTTSAVLAKVFNEPDIVAALSNYMGGRYAYSGCAFELSVPETVWWGNRYGRDDESVETAYYHLDQSWRFPKMICYLSEVTDETGPTALLSAGLRQSELSWATGRALDGIHIDPNRGTDMSMAKMLVCSDLGRKCFAALPKEMRCLGHFGNDLLAGSPEERYFVSNRKVMTGSAGSFVVFDGSRTAHRGGIVRKHHRWAFQVVYAKQP
jgi:hypothetical protein